MENIRDMLDITPEKEYVTWKDIEYFIEYIGKQIDITQINGVYGPARGGVTFAVMLSHKYNLPYLGAPQKGCLVVDDICDTGNTALCWKEKGYTIATMYYKKESKVIPDIWLREKTDKWIVFPWEA